MSRPTPETDSQSGYPDDSGCWKYNDLGLYVDADFARRLERERDEAIDRLREWSSWCVQYRTERDEAREELLAFKQERVPMTNLFVLVNEWLEEIFCDGEDTHDDWMKMGNIARDYLKGLE